MASAPLGKYIGFLALVLLLYSCYAFKIREHGVQTISLSVEPQHRATCASIFGRCTEKTTLSSRKWHETAAKRLASTRKPPAEVTSVDDDDDDDDDDADPGTREARTKLERIRRITDRVADDFGNKGGRSRSTEADIDDDEVIVEIDEDTGEVVASDDQGDKDSDVDDEDEQEEDGESEDKSEQDSRMKVDEVKVTAQKIIKSARKFVDGDQNETHKEKHTARKNIVLKRHPAGKSLEEEEEKAKGLNDDEGAEESEEEEDEDEDDEDDDEETEKEASAPPLRKLEKVRLADKDKVRSAEVSSVLQKPKAETGKPVEPAKKQVETVKKVVESTKKITEESSGKPAESSKKVESVKITKSASESSKLKSTQKSEEMQKEPAKPVVSKAPSKMHEQSQQPKKTTLKTVTAKSIPSTTAEAKRFKKDETKPKSKTHMDVPFTLAHLNDAILSVPTFVPNFTAVENFECQQHGKIFLRQLRGYKMWALQMLDSSAKIPSGLLRGNVNQFGDFDECLGVQAHVKLNNSTVKVQGKYCLANIDLFATHPDMKVPVHMMQGRGLIRGTIPDPGHFIPKFTTVNWAVCLPAACSAEDAQTVIEQALNKYNSTLGMRFSIKLDPRMCYVKQAPPPYPKETIAVLYFYATFVCIVAVATIRDYIVLPKGKGNYSERIIMAFSLRRTMNSLWKADVSKADITCIHGIRTLGMIAIFVAHKILPLSNMPYANRVEISESSAGPIGVPLKAAILYTESFLLISGVLTAYNMTHEYRRRGEIRWFCRIITRYIRLTPPLLVVLFWYAFVMEHIGTGPLWNNIVMKNVELCKSNAWTNLLYIQNLYPFDEMCATHTHQLATDMQLSLLAPVLVFFLECKMVIGLLIIFFFILLAATLRYLTMMSNHLTLILLHGISVRVLYKSADYTYTTPLHRCPSYILGVGLGVMLYHTGRDIKIHKIFVIFGWLATFAMGFWSFIAPWQMSKLDYVYDVEEVTNYCVISPIFWSLCLCWVIFACHTKNAEILNKFLSNYWFLIFSRLSYAIYLTQFAVFFYHVGTTRYSSEYQLHTAVGLIESGAILTVSILVTLIFDIPMQETKNVIMECTDTLNVKDPSKEKSAQDGTDEAQKLVKTEQAQENVFTDWQKDIVFGGKNLSDRTMEDEDVNMPILKQSGVRRRPFVAHDSLDDDLTTTWERIKESKKRLAADDDEYREKGGRSRNGLKDYQNLENEPSELSRLQQEREEAVKRSRYTLNRNFDAKILSSREDEDEEEYPRRWEEEDDPRRYRRSESRGRSVIRESDDYRSWEFVGKDRSSSKGPDSKRLSGKSDEYEPAQRQTRAPLLSSNDTRRAFSSESEDELSQRKKVEKRHPSVEPRISDEEDWESELRIRRKEFMEKLATQQQQQSPDEEQDLSSLRRRSSAEGKIALLKDPSADDNMDSWTVSVGSRVALLGSSQERSEPEEDNAYIRRKEYRERTLPPREDTQSEEEVIWDASRRRSNTSSSQMTSLEEDEDARNFVLTRDSRKISLHDLSSLPQEDTEVADSGWNVVKEGTTETLPKANSMGLFKRESIIKSQASEEDPEYLLPERPKLVQQEREHPFKKAWQIQKSRSEEDGSSFIIKDGKEQPRTKEKWKNDDFSSMKRERSGEQYADVESFADDDSEAMVLSRSRSTDTEDARTDSKSEERESTSMERSTSTSTEDIKANSKSDVEPDSLEFNWPSEDKQYEVYKTNLRRKSEETDWNWETEET